MEIGTLKDTTIYLKLEAKRQPLRRIPNIGFSNPKRYDEHPYHFAT